MPSQRQLDRLKARARSFALLTLRRSRAGQPGEAAAEATARPRPWHLPRHARRHVIVALVPLLGAVTAFGFAPLNGAQEPVAVHHLAEELSPPAVVAVPGAAPGRFVSEETVRRGDTLGTLLTRLRVNDSAAEAFIRGSAAARAFYQLRPGRPVQAVTAADGTLQTLRYVREVGESTSAPAASSLVLERDGERFAVRDEPLALERHLVIRGAEITTSLFAATDAAGIPDAVAAQIPSILEGDIDFYRDLRRGDRLRVVYESFVHDGSPARSGRVLALELVASGKVHDAVWYAADGAEGGYFTHDGASLHRAFLRTPLQFTRISSGFGGRVHPILNIWKWHTGIDYAAPVGTPVRATGDAVAAFVGRQNGYGNVIILRHRGSIETVYGHLSAFAPGLRAGRAVAQGQVIGQVGMTGWATGPHLHYEFRVAGQAKDPLRVALPDAPPVEPSQRAAFRERTAEVEHALALLRGIDASAQVAPAAARGA